MSDDIHERAVMVHDSATHPHNYVRDLSDVTYILAALFFILSLSGLSKHETATRGNMYGVIAMFLSVSVTFFDPLFGHPGLFFLALTPGALLGAFLALRVQMTSMPQLVALLHSFVGIAAVLVGVANAVHSETSKYNATPLLHKIEIFVGVFIGSVTVTGSLVAAGKLHEWLRSAPLILGGSSTVRHAFNITILALCALLGWRYCDSVDSYNAGLYELCAMVVLAGVLGWHLVMSIGGADMPVVVSMLNSYSGWATAASGFMLESNLLIITGSLVGSSGAILSYIMCRAMNRSFANVILGGLSASTDFKSIKTADMQDTANIIKVDGTIALLQQAKSIIIVPGYSTLR